MNTDISFEPSWDDAKQVWRVSVYGLEDEPVELPGIARLGRLHALRACVIAAAIAAPSALSDDGGMYWRTKTEAKKAATAAKSSAR